MWPWLLGQDEQFHYMVEVEHIVPIFSLGRSCSTKVHHHILCQDSGNNYFPFLRGCKFFVRRILRPLLALLSTFGLCIYRAFLFELQQFWIIFSFAIITWGWLVTSLPPCIRVSGIAPQPFIIFVRVPAIVMIFVLWTVNFFVRRILRPLLALLSTYRKLKLWVFALPF